MARPSTRWTRYFSRRAATSTPKISKAAISRPIVAEDENTHLLTFVPSHSYSSSTSTCTSTSTSTSPSTHPYTSPSPSPPQPHLSNAALHALETHHLTHRLSHDIDDILAVYTDMATDMGTAITFDTPTSIDVAPDPPMTIDVGSGRAAPTDAVMFTRPKLQRFKDTPPPPPSYDKLAFGKEVWEGVGRGAFQPGRGWERL